MMKVAVQDLGDVTIFHCTGRIAFGYEDRLLTAISKQPGLRVAVLDLAEVAFVDAAGLGLLVSVRKWARTSGVALKLMNLAPRVEDLLELTKLRSAFEVCSVPEMVRLLCRALDQSQLVDVGAVVESTREVLHDAGPVFVHDLRAEGADHGFIYGHGFQDLDGHFWELAFMEPSAIKPA